jgi:hypothetical protein
MTQKTILLGPNRNFPDVGTVGKDAKSLAQNIQTISDALDIGQRNTKNLGDSFIRVDDLIGLGFATLNGKRLTAAQLGVQSPLTAKGDIWVFGTANTRFPVGADGYVLSADSSQPTGLKWVIASAGSVTSVGITSSDLSVTGSPVTASGSITLDINTGAVTLAKMAALPGDTLIGNNTGTPATPIALTVAQVQAMLGLGTDPTATMWRLAPIIWGGSPSSVYGGVLGLDGGGPATSYTGVQPLDCEDNRVSPP